MSKVKQLIEAPKDSKTGNYLYRYKENLISDEGYDVIASHEIYYFGLTETGRIIPIIEVNGELVEGNNIQIESIR